MTKAREVHLLLSAFSTLPYRHPEIRRVARRPGLSARCTREVSNAPIAWKIAHVDLPSVCFGRL